MLKIDAVYGKILALLKHYYLKPPQDDRYVMRFFSGKRGAYPPGIGLEWWTDPLGFTLRDELARMAITFDPALRGGADVKSFAATIQTFLKAHALDRPLFNTSMMFGRASTLFDARGSQNERDFAAAIWEKLRIALAESIVTWLVFYPLQRVSSDSFALGYDGLHVMRPDDRAMWPLRKKLISQARRRRSHPRTSHERRDAIQRGRTFLASWLPANWCLQPTRVFARAAEASVSRASVRRCCTRAARATF